MSIPEPAPSVTPTSGWKAGVPPMGVDVAWLCVDDARPGEIVRFVILARRMTGLHEDEVWAVMASCPNPKYGSPGSETFHEAQVASWASLPVPEMPFGLSPAVPEPLADPAPSPRRRSFLKRLFRRS